MKNSDFTLELSDGTLMKVGVMGNASFPDVKNYFLPSGILVPFSHKNLPSARQDELSDRALNRQS